MNWKPYSKILLVAVAVAVGSCYPHGPEYYEDTDVVLTNHVQAYDFTSKNTYAVPDSIVKITGNVLDGDPPKFVPKVVSTALIADIVKNMSALGYTRVDITQNPDLILLPAAIETTTIVYWYDYWGWWWGGYYPGGGYPWYPYYPYYPSYSSYSTGTLVMSLVDPKVSSGDGRPVSQWVGAIAGLLSNSYDAARAERLVDQAFTQSPYLKTN